jgi:hypothetical protein
MDPAVDLRGINSRLVSRGDRAGIVFGLQEAGDLFGFVPGDAGGGFL